MNIWTDERGKASFARVALSIVLMAALAFIALDTLGAGTLSAAALSFLGSVTLALIGWAGGSRIAQHLFGALPGVIEQIRQAATHRRRGDDAP